MSTNTAQLRTRTKSRPRRPPQFDHEPYHRHQYAYWQWENRCFWIFLTIFALGFLATFIVLAFTNPYPVYPYFHAKLHTSDAGVRRKASHCMAGEIWDDDLESCAPLIHTPVPVDSSLMDTSTQPCDSFYDHMCGAWVQNHTNENRAFTYVWRKNRKRVHDIVVDPKSGPVYNFYRSCLDTLVHKQHSKETKLERNHVLEHILGALRSHADLPVVFARLNKYGFAAPFQVNIEQHPRNTELVPVIRYDGFPDGVNLGNMTQTFVGSGRLNIVGLGRRATELESIVKKLNSFHIADADGPRDIFQYLKEKHDTRDIIPFKELGHATFWTNYFRELNGIEMDVELENNPTQQVWLLNGAYLHALFEEMPKFSIHQWRAFVEYSVLYHTHDYLPRVPGDSYFRTHETIVDDRQLEHYWGRHHGEIREEHCVAITHRLLPGMIAKEFLHRYMPDHERVRREITGIVENVRNSFADLIEQTEWMSAETRQKSADKVRAMIVRAVHPNVWEVEPFHARISKDRYLRNINLIRQYRSQRHFQRWYYKHDRDALQRFGAPLTTVNAYYSPQTNTITVFAGLIQQPFFDKDYSPMSLYATVGMIAGHEMSHGLDNTGRLFTKEGVIREWWTPEDVRQFEERAKCIIKEYRTPTGCTDGSVDYGHKTLGENIADITGFQIAWNAYFHHRHEHEHSSAEPVPFAREGPWFFQVNAQMWCESYDQEHQCSRARDDVHAQARDRVDKTFRQMKDFGKVYMCTKHSKMTHKNICKIYGPAK